ncbi:helix-turn-helix transcriptional regulator [Phenylobacterium sp. LjRoot219]|uniref:helix-turn-helix domain-containing protein n=1 Tax=Phenylobacterium sp. LjRoot219 TaxID=3342283 RepID=UPI003ECE30E9
MATFARRPNPVFSDEYRALVAVLATARKRAGVTQRGLADRLGKASSHVQRIEGGQRRVDALELYQIAKLLQVDPGELFEQIAAKLDELEPLRSAGPARP